MARLRGKEHSTDLRPASMSVQRSLTFWLQFAVLLWLAHLLAYFLHEFGHSFTAWIAGYKANPLALNYGHLNAANLLLQSGVDENVDYGPVFAAGRGSLAALIAAAGVLVNVVLYLFSRRLYTVSRRRGRRTMGLFAFLFCVMNAGNFLDYVPVRTFTPHGDMATLEKGLQLSPWWIVAVAGIPFAWAIAHLLSKLLPDARAFLFPDSRPGQTALVLASCVLMFGYYGAAGMYGYGEVSHRISLSAVLVMLPGTMILCWPRKGELRQSGRIAV
jgi:hypothetical protein